MFYESIVSPHHAGFGMYQIGEISKVDYTEDIKGFECYMDTEYIWEWTDELDGMIYNQNGGDVFKFRISDDHDWTYGIIWEDED